MDIIAKIQKLLSLASSDNPNEAATAAAQAARLMDEHRISSETLAEASDPMVKAEQLYGDPFKRRSSWKEQLAAVVGSHNGVYVVIISGLITITGRKSDILITRYMFDFCYREIDRITKIECKGQGKSYSNNFRLGCVMSIDRALRADRAQNADAEQAIVLVDTRLEAAKKLFTDLKTVSSGRSTDDFAVYHGMAAGESIQLRKGMEGSDSKTLALGAGE